MSKFSEEMERFSLAGLRMGQNRIFLHVEFYGVSTRPVKLRPATSQNGSIVVFVWTNIIMIVLGVPNFGFLHSRVFRQSPCLYSPSGVSI